MSSARARARRMKIAAHMTGMEFDDDRRHGEGRHRRDLQYAGRSVEGQGAGAGRQLRALGSGRDHRPRLQPARAGARSFSCTTSTASTTQASRSPSSATACSRQCQRQWNLRAERNGCRRDQSWSCGFARAAERCALSIRNRRLASAWHVPVLIRVLQPVLNS